jgi:hypothetical protein
MLTMRNHNVNEKSQCQEWESTMLIMRNHNFDNKKSEC